jgi:YHS domain-containing protein
VKGIDRPIELYRADPSDREPVRRLTDPVCGMQLGDEEAAARVTVSGETFVFCSITCLTRFTSRTAPVADAPASRVPPTR